MAWRNTSERAEMKINTFNEPRAKLNGNRLENCRPNQVPLP